MFHLSYGNHPSTLASGIMARLRCNFELQYNRHLVNTQLIPAEICTLNHHSMGLLRGSIVPVAFVYTVRFYPLCQQGSNIRRLTYHSPLGIHSHTPRLINTIFKKINFLFINFFCSRKRPATLRRNKWL